MLKQSQQIGGSVDKMSENLLQQELERLEAILLAGEMSVSESYRLKGVRQALAKIDALRDEGAE